FHYEGFSSSKGEVIADTRTEEDKFGVYEAEVMIDDVEKQSNQGRSSFFPEEWSSQEVVLAINEAHETRKGLTGNTDAGLTVAGQLRMVWLVECVWMTVINDALGFQNTRGGSILSMSRG